MPEREIKIPKQSPGENHRESQARIKRTEDSLDIISRCCESILDDRRVDDMVLRRRITAFAREGKLLADLVRKDMGIKKTPEDI